MGSIRVRADGDQEIHQTRWVSAKEGSLEATLVNSYLRRDATIPTGGDGGGEREREEIVDG